jgi:hypothetical protein
MIHGTLHAYRNLGCRCGECTAAQAAQQARYRSKITPADVSEHGTYNAYVNYSCRCPDCRAANAAQSRRQYAAKKAQ